MAEELRVVLRNYGKINPLNIDDYINAGGYKSLEKARSMSQMDVIQEVKKSGLRGRGGAGFNAGQKWMFAYQAQADQKYVICNADEGEPGTYKDRIIMESDPHSVLEGMAICGYAIGANKGYIYCRGEYPYVVDILNTAIAQAKAKGVLGEFDIEVRMGAGAYVCGEETALIESIEGSRGEPRYKPPFPPVSGLWGKPSIVNNVETFANIAIILEKGADWYASLGAPSYPGTKVLTLTGDVVNKKFIEVPTNTTIREVVYGFGGGIPGGKKFKAVQIGGTSGGFIPESLLDTPIDFDSMAAIGATLGSGAVLVMDETRDIVDVVERIAKFFEHESCGKCAPCREGTMRMYKLMSKVNKGQGTAKDVALMERLGRVMSVACLCGLGQAAPTPVLTTIKHFRADYDAKLQ
ncbi:MAG TPA: NADH-quinone oxidoreductase subunit NuoF [Syntrophothermus lipocalidus]|uniref:NADH dehydrogenase (Quinone) n=1 Tax=Syntrophothermus lipocalidus (strain DSM 12680 / TGB-C1) TaxID=643648 RepID=D7CIQ9_SYNLT|nr:MULTISPECIES: NADH-quinone oxidoreductase subunit NuoF [Syntrophothermus]ADI00924.1 NADH dehydrogenase (quinone) [Syntrophothermus lipocalidus DSM 12680]NSW82951.1 NADH-quinone oxidoreductase subunit NuoF [Syntrophothermus sp.]HHV77254.1 NADH-quinone oxidoreductase subunit NuoF [Syntrophothermus lipocalidus]